MKEREKKTDNTNRIVGMGRLQNRTADAKGYGEYTS